MNFEHTNASLVSEPNDRLLQRTMSNQGKMASGNRSRSLSPNSSRKNLVPTRQPHTPSFSREASHGNAMPSNAYDSPLLRSATNDERELMFMRDLQRTCEEEHAKQVQNQSKRIKLIMCFNCS